MLHKLTGQAYCKLSRFLEYPPFSAVDTAVGGVVRTQDTYSGPRIPQRMMYLLSIASGASLCSSNLLHFCYPFLKFLILAFLVAVSLVLHTRQHLQYPAPASSIRTSHFQGKYHSLARHLFNGIRRWAQLSLY